MLEALARAGSKLKHLHIETLLKTEKNGAQFLLSFPSLTSLHLLDGICVSHEVIEPCIKKQGPKLERLTLIGCWIGIETVLLIMEACPNLKFLDLSYQPPSIALMGTEAPVIGNGTLGVIADNGNNLEELILKYYPAGAMAEDA